MRSTWMTWASLLGLVIFATGASVEGLQEARRWQRYGDIPTALGQWDAAYVYYRRIAELFPDTARGRYAASRSRRMRSKLLRPERGPGEESGAAWVGEFIDFLTWP